MQMQKELIEFHISCGYPKAANIILELVKARNESRNDVKIQNQLIDSVWGCAEFSLVGTWDAYKMFLDLSRVTEEPESWFSIEHFHDDIV